ncbi:retrovirus-related pol polyprotein from transposon TNT 1-94 [Tanacetum coccineum]
MEDRIAVQKQLIYKIPAAKLKFMKSKASQHYNTSRFFIRITHRLSLFLFALCGKGLAAVRFAGAFFFGASVLRAQLFNKTSEQKNTINGTSVNTKVAKPSVLGKPSLNFGTKLYDVTPLPKSLPKFVTSHSVPMTHGPNVVKNSNVIALGMFRINPSQTSRVENFVPNKQGVECTANTRRPLPRSNTRNDRAPFASKSSCIKNKEVEVEDHHRDILFSKNQRHLSSECNNIKLAIRNDKSDVVYAMCEQCFVTANHDVCVISYVNDMNFCANNLNANVPNIAYLKRYRPKVRKPTKIGSKERLALPQPSSPRTCLKWSPTGRTYSQTVSKFHFSSWQFLGTVCFGNDHVAVILGFGDLKWGNILITRVYFVKGVDLLKGNHSTNLYTINLHDIASASPICLMARATSTKSWLWHQRLSHLNFDTINDLAKNDLVSGLPKFKYSKEHLCPSCEQGKSKRASYPPKHVLNSKQRLHLLYMDLCGLMRVECINGKWYVLVIVDDYSFLLQALVIIIRTNNDTKFKNQVLKEYFNTVGITHQSSSVKTPQQNGVVERRNRTLVEATRTMLIFSHASLFLWAEVIATACYTQNRFIIHRRFNKTPYELIQRRKPDISFLHVFGALCYPKNDCEDIGKLGAKGDY